MRKIFNFSSIFPVVAIITFWGVTAASGYDSEIRPAPNQRDNRVEPRSDHSVEYCLVGESEPEVESDLLENAQLSRTFPLYGSDEERIFRQSAIILSYRGTFDLKLRKAFKKGEKELSRECILIPVSESNSE